MQLTLGVDRDLGPITSFNEYHPSVLNFMQLAIATARRLGKYVSISATMLSDAVLAFEPLTFEKPACEHFFACSPGRLVRHAPEPFRAGRGRH